MRWVGAEPGEVVSGGQGKRSARCADDRLRRAAGDGTTWCTLVDPADVKDAPILGATNAMLVRRLRPNDAYRIAVPFTP